MAYHFVGVILLERWERESLTPDELKFVRYHEEAHNIFCRFTPLFTRKKRCEVEVLCNAHAFKMMMAEGHGFEALVKMELDYRLLKKYGMRLEEFKKVMGGRR